MAGIIEVNNISKLYKLGQISSGTIKDDLSSWWSNLWGKEDPNSKIGQIKKADDKLHWALRDISFEVKQGEVLGIIGKNGAGKSTLLKILSRVTSPTTGSIRIRGRIASLLEVGTGFHPDLTGRENIYQNGAILGMHKAEIKRKFDDIVAFSGVERFIDTPVKRYSSGMYVRLAFAVAAHLEPEILIVDEVLAVGDADFQKKCLGKMHDVSVGEGRTVMFVSHNMTAIQTLCNSVILLKDGMVHSSGTANQIVNNYLGLYSENLKNREWQIEHEGPGNEHVKFRHVKLGPEGSITINDQVVIDFSFYCYLQSGKINISLHLYTLKGDLVFATVSPEQDLTSNLVHFACKIPPNFLNDEMYVVSIMVVSESKPLYFFEEAMKFEVSDVQRTTAWVGKWPGQIRPTFDWEYYSLER